MPNRAQHTPQALLHLPGVGPRKEAQLRACGRTDWYALTEADQGSLPGLSGFGALHEALHRNIAAYESGDLLQLVTALRRCDHWRVLADFYEHAAFLDIETSGDPKAPEVTTIVCKHQGVVHAYMADGNLDDFLPLLDDMKLVVTFNGASFDIPQLENHFHIPLRDIAHIDLRWVCYHAGLKGGLKDIERAIGLERPRDLIGMDGAEADWLWRRWQTTGNANLLSRLKRYCAADVVGLDLLAQWLVARKTGSEAPPFLWDGLPEHEELVGAQDTPAPTVSASPDNTTMERMRKRMRAMQRHQRRA